MLSFVDNLLNRFTMYRIVLYGLSIQVLAAIIVGFVGLLPYNGLQMFVSLLILVALCYGSNLAFSTLFRAPRNTESFLITALILFFVLAPPGTWVEASYLAAAAIVAMFSKYILVFRKKHLFNPAALSAFVLGLFGSGLALWWVATPVLLPFTILIGLAIVRKIRRFTLLLAFLVTAVASIFFTFWSFTPNISELLRTIFASFPLVFFGTVMLTEPLTTPPTRWGQIAYGALVGILFGLQFHIGPVYSSPELVLLLGNIFSFLISPKYRLKLTLKETNQLAPMIREFVFQNSSKINFRPGQYLEWTLPHTGVDDRGNRRYFTISSSPTEQDIRLTIKIAPRSSTFKQKLLDMTPGSLLYASQLSGDFVLPADPTQKLVFIAGGIGITPFRSMIRYLVDRREKRDITLFYAVSSADEYVFQDLWQAARLVGVKTVPILTQAKTIPSKWEGEIGYISAEILDAEVPDYRSRLFFLSGPNVMVNAYKKLLLSLGVSRRQIKTDYFPGF